MSCTNEEVTAFVERNTVPKIVRDVWEEFVAFSTVESPWMIGFLMLMIGTAISFLVFVALQSNGIPTSAVAFVIGIGISVVIGVVAGVGLFFYNRYKRNHISRDDFVARQSTEEISTAEYECVAQVKAEHKPLEFSLQVLCTKKATLTKQDLAEIVFLYFDNRLIDEKAAEHAEQQQAMQAHCEARKAALGDTGGDA